jgi:NgoMIV restriction enzyme
MSITLADGDLIVLDSEGIRREAETGERLAAQTSGSEFESINAEFVRETFMKMGHIRPGEWEVKKISGRNRLSIASFEQYAHLHALDGCRQSEPGSWRLLWGATIGATQGTLRLDPITLYDST